MIGQALSRCIGIKKDGLFMFASELKSFHEHPAFQNELNHDGLTLFLQYGYIPQPHTIF